MLSFNEPESMARTIQPGSVLPVPPTRYHDNHSAPYYIDANGLPIVPQTLKRNVIFENLQPLYSTPITQRMSS
jgi:hypothetical protein